MSVIRNFGYNLILTFCSYLFPFITYPYVSRVLGVENIGACNFIESLINNFTLVAALGVGTYGVREIAKHNHDLAKRNEIFSNLVAINVVTTLLAVALLVVCTYSIDSLQPYKEFIWIGISKLVFTAFLIDWFFQGIEKFKYITVSSVLIRFVYLVCIFLFVKTADDTQLYFALTCGMVVVNAVVNWNYSRSYRKFSFKSLRVMQYLLPILIYGMYRVLTSMYTTFNTVFLGFSSGDVEVGYFSTSTKLYTVILGVFTAFTTVMVPRVSQMIKNKQMEEVQVISTSVIQFIVITTLPCIIYCIYNAQEIIALIAGPGYEGAVSSFRIVIFLLLIIALEQVAIQQILLASDSKRSIVYVSLTGAVVGISLNFLITPQWGSIGSAIAWGCSELSVLLVGIWLVRRYLGLKLYIVRFKDIFSSALYLLPLAGIHYWVTDGLLRLIVSTVVFALLFVVINVYMFPNKTIAATFRSLKKD